MSMRKSAFYDVNTASLLLVFGGKDSYKKMYDKVFL